MLSQWRLNAVTAPAGTILCWQVSYSRARRAKPEFSRWSGFSLRSSRCKKFVTRLGKTSDDFIELGIDDICVSVLAALNDEHHQEGHGTGDGVHNQLPCI